MEDGMEEEFWYVYRYGKEWKILRMELEFYCRIINV